MITYDYMSMHMIHNIFIFISLFLYMKLSKILAQYSAIGDGEETGTMFKMKPMFSQQDHTKWTDCVYGFYL